MTDKFEALGSSYSVLLTDMTNELIGPPLTAVQKRKKTSRELKKREKEERTLARACGAFHAARFQGLPMTTKEEAVASSLAILPILIRLFAGPLFRLAVEWLWNRYFSASKDWH